MPPPNRRTARCFSLLLLAGCAAAPEPAPPAPIEFPTVSLPKVDTAPPLRPAAVTIWVTPDQIALAGPGQSAPTFTVPLEHGELRQAERSADAQALDDAITAAWRARPQAPGAAAPPATAPPTTLREAAAQARAEAVAWPSQPGVAVIPAAEVPANTVLGLLGMAQRAGDPAPFWEVDTARGPGAFTAPARPKEGEAPLPDPRPPRIRCVDASLRITPAGGILRVSDSEVVPTVRADPSQTPDHLDLVGADGRCPAEVADGGALATLLDAMPIDVLCPRLGVYVRRNDTIEALSRAATLSLRVDLEPWFGLTEVGDEPELPPGRAPCARTRTFPVDASAGVRALQLQRMVADAAANAARERAAYMRE